MTEYTIKQTPLDRLTITVKILSGVEEDNRAWDTIFYGRTKKTVKLIYEYFTLSKLNDKIEPEILSSKFIEDIVNIMKIKGLSWTIETLIKHLPDWERQILKYGEFKDFHRGL